MKTGKYMPLAAYIYGAIGAAINIGIALSIAAITNPAYRIIHVGLAGVHLTMLVFWLRLYSKARRSVPVKPKKTLSLSQARSLVSSMTFSAVVIGAMSLWAGYMACSPIPGMPNPRLQLGNVLTALSIQVNALMIIGMMMTVALQSLAEAKAALNLQNMALEQEQVVTPTQGNWWTQDETRQELRRK